MIELMSIIGVHVNSYVEALFMVNMLVLDYLVSIEKPVLNSMAFPLFSNMVSLQ